MGEGSPTFQKGGNINIYVGNLSLDVTEGELRREFMAFGEVISVVIMNDKYIGSGQTRGYGFVEMASKSEGEAAITSLKGKRLTNRVIDVVKALPLSDKRGTVTGTGIKGDKECKTIKISHGLHSNMKAMRTYLHIKCKTLNQK